MCVTPQGLQLEEAFIWLDGNPPLCGAKEAAVIFSLSALFESGDVEAFVQEAGGEKKKKMALCHRAAPK